MNQLADTTCYTIPINKLQHTPDTALLATQDKPEKVICPKCNKLGVHGHNPSSCQGSKYVHKRDHTTKADPLKRKQQFSNGGRGGYKKKYQKIVAQLASLAQPAPTAPAAVPTAAAAAASAF